MEGGRGVDQSCGRTMRRRQRCELSLRAELELRGLKIWKIVGGVVTNGEAFYGS